MTFESNLAETEMIEIPELYDFEYAGIYDRYTSYSTDLEFQSQTYLRATIQRSGFTVDTEFGKVSMTIKTPLVPTLSTYIANQPVERTRVTIWRALLSDLTDYRVLFKGDVLRVSFKGAMCQASCEMQSHILAQRLPTIVHQSFCNHQIFDAGCTLNDLTWRLAATITGISSDQYTSSTFGTKPDGYYIGGMLTKDNDSRHIINHVGNNVWLHVPFDDRVGLGDTVWALPGCDGAPDTCRDTFSNFSNFLGFPYIPDSNPVMWGFR